MDLLFWDAFFDGPELNTAPPQPKTSKAFPQSPQDCLTLEAHQHTPTPSPYPDHNP